MTRKIIRFAGAGLLTAAVCFGSPVRANDEPLITLAPSSPWTVEYADDSCRIARVFGSGDDEVIVILERFVPGDSFSLHVGGAPLKSGSANSRPTIEFGPDGLARTDDIAQGRFGKYDPALIVRGMSLYPILAKDDQDRPESKAAAGRSVFEQYISFEQEKAIDWLEVRREGGATVRLALGSMGAPLAAMRTCTDELVGHWGIDVAAHRALTRQVAPKGNPASWVTMNDYPQRLLREGSQGIVNFRVMVDKKGKPFKCAVQRSTRPVGFDKVVCDNMMRRARFTPALDATGNPIDSFWRSSVTFATF